MLIELLLFCAAGIIAGTITGLIPGIHPNMIALGVPLMVSQISEPVLIAAFAVSMSVCNSITDFIPSILFGAPEEGTELTALPGHEMLLEGRGYEAIKLTVFGGVAAVMAASALFPILLFAVPLLYGAMLPLMHFILISFSLYIVIGNADRKDVNDDENEKLSGKTSCWRRIGMTAAIFLAAGATGMLISSVPVNPALALFPLLAGFFGVPLLLTGTTTAPKQTLEEEYMQKAERRKAVLGGTAAGIVSGFLPGVGSSVMASLFGKRDKRRFLITVGGITSSNVLLSFFSLLMIERARSGVAAAVGQIAEIDMNVTLIAMAAALLAAGAGAVITIAISRKVISGIHRMNYSAMNKGVAALIAVMTYAFTGLPGLAILFTASSIGICTNRLGVRRTAMMGSLLVPVTIFYIFA